MLVHERREQNQFERRLLVAVREELSQQHATNLQNDGVPNNIGERILDDGTISEIIDVIGSRAWISACLRPAT